MARRLPGSRARPSARRLGARWRRRLTVMVLGPWALVAATTGFRLLGPGAATAGAQSVGTSTTVHAPTTGSIPSTTSVDPPSSTDQVEPSTSTTIGRPSLRTTTTSTPSGRRTTTTGEDGEEEGTTTTSGGEGSGEGPTGSAGEPSPTAGGQATRSVAVGDDVADIGSAAAVIGPARVVATSPASSPEGGPFRRPQGPGADPVALAAGLVLLAAAAGAVVIVAAEGRRA